MYDAVFVLVEAFNKLLRKKPDQFRSYTMRNRMGQILAPVTNISSANTTASNGNANTNRVLDCNTSKGWVNAWLVLHLDCNSFLACVSLLLRWFLVLFVLFTVHREHGDKISRYLRKVSISKDYVRSAWSFSITIFRSILFLVHMKVEIEGLTGDIRFNEDGRRENYTLSVMEMTVDSGLVKVADWSDRYGLVQLKKNAGSGGIGDRVQARVDYERNRTYVVTTVIEEPYLMLRKGKPGKVLEGNELYEGYCKDLADLIAHKLGINCTYNHTFTLSHSDNWY